MKKIDEVSKSNQAIELMKNDGLTQKEACNTIGISVSAVSHALASYHPQFLTKRRIEKSVAHLSNRIARLELQRLALQAALDVLNGCESNSSREKLEALSRDEDQKEKR